MGVSAQIPRTNILKPTTLIGKYQIIEILAKGGMAEVYKAKRYGLEGFEKILVLKRILPELSRNREFVDLFINEAKIAMHLSHTNIVQVLDLDQEQGEYFIVMEYVYGMNLAEVIRRSFTRNIMIPPEMMAFIAGEVAKGLDYAHRRRGPDMRPLGIVHRDVSPQNILISYEGEVKITDFGIAAAKHVVDRQEEGFVKGKFAYMAPEQALGEKVDARADIFSLGVVLYEMASGQNPFRQATGRLTLERLVKQELMPITEAAPHIPAELASIIKTCLATDPERRYPNAGRLYEDLLAFIFTTGKRVSSSSLANFVSCLREGGAMMADEALGDTIGEDISLSPAALSASSIPDITDATNVAIPVKREEIGKEEWKKKEKTEEEGEEKEEGEEGPDLSMEQHDFTLMSLEYFSLEGRDERSLLRIDQIVESKGGRIVEEGKGYIVALFGMGEISGKETEVAVGSAIKIKQVARNLRKQEGKIIPIGVCIKPVKLTVDKLGKPVGNEHYLRSIVETRDIAQRHPGKIILGGAKAEDLEEKFEVERADAIDPSLGSGTFVLLREKATKFPQTKFIGRQLQMHEMADLLAAASKGSGRVIGITGDPGIGKSRFIEEVRSRLRHRARIFWYQTSCLPQQQEIPMSAIASMLRVITGITEDDSDKSAREKVGRLREIGASREEIEATATVIGIASERKSGPETSAPLVQSLLSRIARRLSEERLTIFVWENLRYMDQESRLIVDSLLSEIANRRVCAILTYRTGFRPTWAWGPHFREMVLGPLSEADCTTLVMELLGQPEEVPSELLTDLITKSGGNPLFLEEYLRKLRHSGAVSLDGGKVTYRRDLASVGIPKTLKGIFAERLSKLSDETKDLVKVASVIGNRFGVDILSEVVGRPILQLAMTLEGLESEGILFRSSLMEYSFSHDFIREAVYDSLTHNARRNLHEKVARAIEASSAGVDEEVLSTLAEHWRESGNRKKAIEYLQRSADKLASGYHYAAALQQYLKAADLIRNSPAANPGELLALYDRIGEMAILSAKMELGIEKMKLAADLAEEIGDRRALILAVTKIGRLATAAGKFSDAQRNLSRALELSEGLTDAAIRRDIYGAIGTMYAKNGEYLQAVGFLEEALRLSQITGDIKAANAYARQLALTMAAQKKKDLAIKYIQEAEKQVQDLDDKQLLCELFKARAVVHFMLREWEQALANSEKALELAKEYHFPYEIAVNSHNLGDIHIRMNNFKKAFTALHFSHELSREYGFKKLEAINMALLGYLDVVRFRSSEGIDKIKTAIKYAVDKQYSWDAVQGKYFLGMAYFELGEFKEATYAFQEAISLGKATGNIMYVEDSERLLREIKS